MAFGAINDGSNPSPAVIIKKMKLNFEKEKKEKLPKIELTFLYLSHLTRKDAETIRKLLKDTDIYCPEGMGFTEEFVEDLNKISQGDKEVLQRYILKSRFPTVKFPDWWLAIFEAIYNSKKIIYLVDLPGKEKMNLANRIEKQISGYDRIEAKFCSGRFKEAIENLKKFIEELVKLQKKREEEIIRNIRDLSEKITLKYPQFKDREKIKILLSVGNVHTFLSHATKDDFLVKEIFPKKPYIYSRVVQALRSYRFKKKLNFNDEFFARIFVEGFISCYLSDFLESTDECEELARKIASKVSYQMIETISKKLKEDKIPPFEASEYIVDFLEKEKIKIPRNKQEAEKMIKNYVS